MKTIKKIYSKKNNKYTKTKIITYKIKRLSNIDNVIK